MKRFALLSMMALAVAALSCTKENEAGKTELDSNTSITNISAYSPSEERGQDVFDITYGDANAIILTTPALTTEDTPVDLTNVVLTVEVAAKASTNVTGPLDFVTNPSFTLVVTAENGDKAEYVLTVVVTPPTEVIPEFTAAFEKVWEKTGTEMQLVCPKSARDITVAGDYFLILDNNVDPVADARIKVYNKRTGEFVQNVEKYLGEDTAPRSYMWSLCADEAGHFAMCRLNGGGAGCWTDIYTDKDTYFNYTVDPFVEGSRPEDLPDCLGKRMTVVGDLTTGRGMIFMVKAHFYGGITDLGAYGTWELQDGVVTTVAPTMTTTMHMWNHAIVQRESLEDATMYIAYTDETGYPSHDSEEWADQHAAHFELSVPGEVPVEVDSKCFEYRILDMQVFNLCGGRFMASLQQTYSTAGAHSVQVYNFTDPEKMDTMEPGKDGYDKFHLYKSEEWTTANDLRYGNVAVDVDEDANCAYIYSFVPAGQDATTEARIVCTKMTVTRTN